MPFSAGYGLLMLLGIAASAALWQRLASRGHRIPLLVFVGGLIGAVLGAKLGYFICELPFRFGKPGFWVDVLVGRTVLGGLLGGYAGVEWAKRESGYKSATGDAFALVVPIGLAIGRIGCLIHGCCLGRVCRPDWYALHDAIGVPRFPVVPAEIIFNLVFAALAWQLHRRGKLHNQLFHIYLIAYGLFRLISEHWRDTPRIGFGVSTYQLLAGLVLIFGAWRWRQRSACSPSAVRIS